MKKEKMMKSFFLLLIISLNISLSSSLDESSTVDNDKNLNPDCVASTPQDEKNLDEDYYCNLWSENIRNNFFGGGKDTTTQQDDATWKALDNVINAIKPYIERRPGSVVLDIGAHLGVFSEALLRSKVPIRKIYLFEPVQSLYFCQIKRLTGNKETTYFNEKRSVFRFENIALGSEDYSFETLFVNDLINTAKENGGVPTGWNTFMKIDPKAKDVNWKSKMKKATTLIRTLSKFIEEEVGIGDDISAIKIDVEGFEGEVLRGALPWLRSLSIREKELPVLIIEVAWGTSHPNHEKNVKTYDELEKIGYCVPRLLNSSNTVDLLFLPLQISNNCNYQPIV